MKPILDFPVPQNVKEVQSFLGLVNFYQEFLEDVASIAEPLRSLTRKDTPFDWNQECELSFQTLKEMLAKNLKVHIFDPNAKTIVTTDASNVGMGALLSQVQDSKELPIAFFNRTLDPAERNYAANEKEALACVRACEHWEKFLLGRHFTLRTDHKALTTLLNNSKDRRQSAKFQRWKERLAEFDYTVEHLAGKENRVADYLSRLRSKADGVGAIIAEERLQGMRLDDFKEASQKDETFLKLQTFLSKEFPHGASLTSDVHPYKQKESQI
ncbi:MAG: hypothetical protein GY696_13890 [Gammaproteobacteria bacterium]|nr:hypothetical protein [Gammaproteobacteria bacterium]